MSKRKFFDLYGHSLGTVSQNEQRILRAQNMELIEKIGAPGVTRTRGTRIRNPLLYPPELQGHEVIFYMFSVGCELASSGSSIPEMRIVTNSVTIARRKPSRMIGE